MNQVATALLMAGVVAFGWGGSARAGPVTWEFEGIVTDIYDPNNVLQGMIQVNDPLLGVYTFESSTPDAFPADPTYGIYQDAITAISGQLGSVPYSGVGPLSSSIQVQGADPGVENDFYSVNVTTLEALGQRLAFDLDFGSDSTDLLDTDALPRFPPQIGSVYTYFGFFVAGEAPGSIVGYLTSIVPEPGGLPLLVIGAAAVGFARTPTWWRSRLAVSFVGHTARSDQRR